MDDPAKLPPRFRIVLELIDEREMVVERPHNPELYELIKQSYENSNKSNLFFIHNDELWHIVAHVPEDGYFRVRPTRVVT